MMNDNSNNKGVRKFSADLYNLSCGFHERMQVGKIRKAINDELKNGYTCNESIFQVKDTKFSLNVLILLQKAESAGLLDFEVFAGRTYEFKLAEKYTKMINEVVMSLRSNVR